MIADHLTCAIEDIDVEVTNLNSQIDAMRERVDELVEARLQLVAARTTLTGSTPTASPGETPTKSETPRATKTTRAKSPKYDLAEIAAIATEAIAAGHSVPDLIMTRTKCPSKEMARYLVSSARSAGHDIPRQRGGPRPTASTLGAAVPSGQVTGKVFSCTECDEEFAQVAHIARHCRLAHNRYAASIERTPTEPAAP